MEVAAICDVDHRSRIWVGPPSSFRGRAYSDYRRLFEKPNLFDAVIGSTPDHMHAPIALAAMALGKHVFCQKPLTHTVEKRGKMRQAAERHRRRHADGKSDSVASCLSHGGAIAARRRDRQGPRSPCLASRRHGLAARTNGQPRPIPCPTRWSWNLWLGVAPMRQFNAELYHPKNWRAWQDFSNGQLGDFGCHILDPVFMGLGLTAPISVEAEAPPINTEVWAPR